MCDDFSLSRSPPQTIFKIYISYYRPVLMSENITKFYGYFVYFLNQIF